MAETYLSTNRTMAEDGDFYVEANCCLLCGVPEDVAPEIFQTGKDYCFVIRQPCSPKEVDRTIRAMWASEVDCVRYRGRDPLMLERLARAGMKDQADYGESLNTPLLARDTVSFEMPEVRSHMTPVWFAHEFRADLRGKGKIVLPALFGKHSVWVSWFKNRFHRVHFADAGQGRFVASLGPTSAVQGLGWLLDDWLIAKGAKDIFWEKTGDPTSKSRTPI
ncbi:hypothetical protein C7W88_14800 [Novosphingobium sp. THN1]|nr:hypothetical protein C7W88_14800 [Novosphingobium sp. THN1]